MNATVRAYAAHESKGKLLPFTYQLPPIGKEEVDVRVLYCGLCHSDLSMINNDWGWTKYPLVPGHEIIGEVIRTGSEVKGIKVGDKVGVGWFSGSCMHCPHCMSGNHHFCGKIEEIIVGRYGGFADTVRAHWAWTIPLPEQINLAKAGPLLCGGITVFNAIIAAGVQPTHKVGVIGIGGLGHLALQFLKHWGCEVVAFSSNALKYDEIRQMGATTVIDSRNTEALQAIKGQLDVIISTVNVPLDWSAYISSLAPRGQLHLVGIVQEPVTIPAMNLLTGERSVKGSPGSGPSLTRTMLEFCVRHNIYPTAETFPMEQVNEAIQHLQAGKARYRIVLEN